MLQTDLGKPFSKLPVLYLCVHNGPVQLGAETELNCQRDLSTPFIPDHGMCSHHKVDNCERSLI